MILITVLLMLCAFLIIQDLLELADNIGPARPQGLSKTVLNRLPVKHFEGNNEDQKYAHVFNLTCHGIATHCRCVVCMSLYESNDSVRHLPCTHDFHKDCIDQWFTVSTSPTLIKVVECVCVCLCYAVLHINHIHMHT